MYKYHCLNQSLLSEWVSWMQIMKIQKMLQMQT